MASNLVGQIVANQFRVDAFISAGGMGTVFRVWDLKRNVPLAMKVLHAEMAEDAVIFERFKREARALRKLEHPNIVPFYGLYQTPSLIFLLERFIDGPTLKDILANQTGGTLPSQDVLTIIKSVCSAVGYAHNNDVIHCDIKAANVMIDLGGHIYLGDFGIARHAESDVTSMPGAGTPAYMAPEQVLGNTVTRETDIYSLGILLFELLTGQRPFRGTERATERSGNTINERIRFAHLNLPAPDPHLLNRNIDPAVSAVVLRALEKDPSARFSSCQDLFTALCHACRVSPEQIPDRLSTQIAAPNPPKPIPIDPSPPKPRAPKNTFVFVGGAVVVVVLLVFFLVSGVNPPGSPSTSPTAKISGSLPANPTAVLVQHFDTKEPLPTETSVKKSPTETPVKKSPTKTPTPTKKPTQTPTASSCAGAKPQRVKVGDKAKVCTRSDRLILRSDPSSSGREIFRMYTGTKLKIIGGPRCGTNFIWWEVRVENNSLVSLNDENFYSNEEEGWVREGSDSVDPYYICPDN